MQSPGVCNASDQKRATIFRQQFVLLLPLLNLDVDKLQVDERECYAGAFEMGTHIPALATQTPC